MRIQRDPLGEMADLGSRAENVYGEAGRSCHTWKQVMTRIMSNEPQANFKRLPLTKDRKNWEGKKITLIAIDEGILNMFKSMSY